jgi:hypothetical protein
MGLTADAFGILLHLIVNEYYGSGCWSEVNLSKQISLCFYDGD